MSLGGYKKLMLTKLGGGGGGGRNRIDPIFLVKNSGENKNLTAKNNIFQKNQRFRIYSVPPPPHPVDDHFLSWYV